MKLYKGRTPTKSCVNGQQQQGIVMASEPQRYLAYLLRVWQVTGSDGVPIVCASLEEVHTGARHGFGSLDQLLVFLMKELSGAPAPHVDPEAPNYDY